MLRIPRPDHVKAPTHVPRANQLCSCNPPVLSANPQVAKLELEHLCASIRQAKHAQDPNRMDGPLTAAGSMYHPIAMGHEQPVCKQRRQTQSFR